MGVDKRIEMKSVDTVKPDLTLVSFRYFQKLGKKSLILEGEITNENLRVVQRSGDHTKTIIEKLGKKIYPASVINLYPVINGLKVGTEYHYQVFDPQVQAIVDVSQFIESFEESIKLSIEPSFKVNTHMHDHLVSSWINISGETIFELAMGGVLITYKENEERARRYLSEAILNKKDLILDLSLVRTENPIPCPREATYLKVSIEGISGQLPLLQGPGQEVKIRDMDGKRVALFRLRSGLSHFRIPGEYASHKGYLQIYLNPSYHIESDHPEIERIAEEVVAGSKTTIEKVDRLVKWVSHEVKDEATESHSALEILHHRKGECQAHTLLYTALARAQGFPTRLVGGLVYMEGMGFLYHSWAESYLDGWIAIDPTFNQIGVDATHIKLVEGDSWISILKLGKIMGRVKAKVMDFQVACEKPD